MSRRKKNEQYDHLAIEDCPEWSENDYDTEDFQYGRGEFSIEADLQFEEHLKRLQGNEKEKSWY